MDASEIKSNGEASPSSWTAVLVLSLAYLLSTGWNIGVQQIENPDEPRYTEPARHMARGDSDWLVPIFNGSKRTVKPILIYWSLAAAGKTGQVLGFWGMDTPMRVVPLLAGWLAVLSVYGIGRRLFNARVGLLAGLILLSTQYFHDISREILTDPLLTGFMAAAWCAFVAAIQDLERDKSRTPILPLLAMYAALGLACMSKGPALIAVCGFLPMAVYLVWERRRYLPEHGGAVWVLHRTGLWWGLPLVLGLGCFWYALLWLNGYQDDVVQIINDQILKRTAGTLDKSKGIRAYPWIFYLGDVPLRFLPWSIFFPVALVWSWKHRRSMSAPGKVLLCSLAIPFVVMGMVGSKRSLYMLPLYPFFALWIARVWDGVMLADAGEVAEKAKDAFRTIWKTLLITVAVLAAVGAAALCYVGHQNLIRRMPPLNGVETIIAAVLALVLTVGAVLAIRDFRRGDSWRGSLQVLALIIVVCLGYEATLRPAEYRADDRFAFYQDVADVVGNRPVVWLGGRCSEAVWYLDRRVVNLRFSARLKSEFFDVPEAVLIVRSQEYEKEYDGVPLLNKAVIELKRVELKGDSFYLVQADPEHPPDSQSKLFSGAEGPDEDDTAD